MKLLKNFATPDELTLLRNLSKTVHHTDQSIRPGLYKYSGFTSVPNHLYTKLLTASELPQPFRGRAIQQFISYEQGGWIAPHKDWVDIGCNLYRVNVLVNAAAKGGECVVNGQEVKLNEGDAILLRAELEEHEIKMILEGSRMIFTVGFHHRTQ